MLSEHYEIPNKTNPAGSGHHPKSGVQTEHPIAGRLFHGVSMSNGLKTAHREAEKQRRFMKFPFHPERSPLDQADDLLLEARKAILDKNHVVAMTAVHEAQEILRGIQR